MSVTDNGGPAFPQPMTSTEMGVHAPDAFGPNYGGMSLRDYFAAAVAAAASRDLIEPEAIAQRAYEVADAMLRQQYSCLTKPMGVSCPKSSGL